MPRLVNWLITIAIAGCGGNDHTRETAGGGFGAACELTSDCGCVARQVDDPFCEKDNTVQLQCLTSTYQCTLSCSDQPDCEDAFGSRGYCDTSERVCMP
jgi:hypothetical protein